MERRHPHSARQRAAGLGRKALELGREYTKLGYGIGYLSVLALKAAASKPFETPGITSRGHTDKSAESANTPGTLLGYCDALFDKALAWEIEAKKEDGQHRRFIATSFDHETSRGDMSVYIEGFNGRRLRVHRDTNQHGNYPFWFEETIACVDPNGGERHEATSRFYIDQDSRINPEVYVPELERSLVHPLVGLDGLEYVEAIKHPSYLMYEQVPAESV